MLTQHPISECLILEAVDALVCLNQDLAFAKAPASILRYRAIGRVAKTERVPDPGKRPCSVQIGFAGGDGLQYQLVGREHLVPSRGEASCAPRVMYKRWFVLICCT